MKLYIYEDELYPFYHFNQEPFDSSEEIEINQEDYDFIVEAYAKFWMAREMIQKVLK